MSKNEEKLNSTPNVAQRIQTLDSVRESMNDSFWRLSGDIDDVDLEVESPMKPVHKPRKSIDLSHSHVMSRTRNN